MSPVSGVVVDTSVWIDFFAGRPAPELEAALQAGWVVLPPVVVAELVSGARRPGERAAIARLVAELLIHDTPPQHWIRVGELRRQLSEKGLAVSTPDAHVAQCALERSAVLLSRDVIFGRIAAHCPLRVRAG
ncbi:MAG: PIN domain-containing protein [Acidobacteria bacterium]|nr:PIN domain-containing protein [Acidobacteriota bacterium]MBI3473209.1 PIN domain-containing protein [Candidatus Solibacter usitatus]